MYCLSGIGLQVLEHLLFDALQGVVNSLDVAAKGLRNLLIALAVQKCAEHLPLKSGERFVNHGLDGTHFLLVDEKLFRVGDTALNHVQQGALALFLVNGFVERHIAVKRDVFLPGGCLDGGDDLPLDTKVRSRG